MRPIPFATAILFPGDFYSGKAAENKGSFHPLAQVYRRPPPRCVFLGKIGPRGLLGPKERRGTGVAILQQARLMIEKPQF